MIPEENSEKETRETAAETADSGAETGKGRRCMKRFAAIAAEGAKFRSNRPTTVRSIAANVFQTTAGAQAPTGRREGSMADRTGRAFRTGKTGKCTMRYAENAAQSFSFLSAREATSLFIAINVSASLPAAASGAVALAAIAAVIRNTRSSSKC